MRLRLDCLDSVTGIRRESVGVELLSQLAHGRCIGFVDGVVHDEEQLCATVWLQALNQELASRIRT